MWSGCIRSPLGIALNFIVNGREVLVPMVIEEPSVVAGASFMARLARRGGGFSASTTRPEMIGQMQVLDVADLAAAQPACWNRRRPAANGRHHRPGAQNLAAARATWKCA